MINFALEPIQFLVQGALHSVDFLIGLDIHCPLLLYELSTSLLKFSIACSTEDVNCGGCGG